jgi:protein TonB
MPSPAHRSRTLPLVLSILAHALALAGLAWFAPLARTSVRDGEPITIRLSQRPPAAKPRVEPPPALDRRRVPVTPEAPVIQPQATDLEELLAEFSEPAPEYATEAPASARRSAIGVGAAGAQRVPRGHAPEGAPGVAVEAAPAAEPPPVAMVHAAPEPVQAPVPLDCPAPEYPAASASVGEQGRVRLEIRIDSAGRVEAVRILRSSGFARLDEAATVGVRRWRFQPARDAGVPVAWRLEHTIHFRVPSPEG